jgi:2'-5' RNA ligase
MRAFIAVPVLATPELRSLLEQLRVSTSSARLVAADQMHLTVKFLGEIADELVPEIERRMAVVASRLQQTTLQLSGLGAFPNLARPTVVWAGFQDAALLVQMAAEMDELLAEVGIAIESRLFTPHLTLARVSPRSSGEVREFVAAHASGAWGSTKLDRLTLFRSTLNPTDPTYDVLSEHWLAAS